MYDNQSGLHWHFQYQGLDLSKAQFPFAFVCPQIHKHSDLNGPFREHPAVDATHVSEFQ